MLSNWNVEWAWSKFNGNHTLFNIPAPKDRSLNILELQNKLNKVAHLSQLILKIYINLEMIITQVACNANQLITMKAPNFFVPLLILE